MSAIRCAVTADTVSGTSSIRCSVFCAVMMMSSPLAVPGWPGDCDAPCAKAGTETVSSNVATLPERRRDME